MLKLTEDRLSAFKEHLRECECSRATIEKYMRDVQAFAVFCQGAIEEKAKLILFKESLIERGYAPASINSILAAVNRFLSFSGYEAWRIRYLKVQRSLFLPQDRELKRKEYERMLEVAGQRRNKRLCMLLQTLCATGIRVSELYAITVESLRERQACIRSKGKVRLILIPGSLCKMLKQYCREKDIKTGAVFVTRSGKPLDRSNIWRMLKQLAQKANVQAQKVFPHNLRHLFACTYYEKYRDIVRLADILGHSSINTTRIYTMRNTQEQLRQINSLNLLSVGGTT